MGQKVLRVLLTFGIVLMTLIFIIFILSSMGAAIGIFLTVVLLTIVAIIIYKLIISGKIFTQPSSKDDESRSKRVGRKTPIGSGMGMGGVNNFTKSGAMVVDKEKSNLPTFNDVAGLDKAKESLQEIVKILKNREYYRSIGARVPKGVLLMGPPGTGKTLLARATAGEADVGFVSMSGSEFVEVFVGVGASRVRDLFDKGRREAHTKGGCIIFIDEIDAVGRTRGTGLYGSGNDERDQTLNQIFTEMDGFEKDTNIIIMAATNRPEVLDPALIRPGRFDRRIVVNLPDRKGRYEILKVHTRDKKLSPNVNLDEIAKETTQFSGSHLEVLANEAALLAAGQSKESIDMEDFEKAIDIVMFGIQGKNRQVAKLEKEITAFHESGHALIMSLLTEIGPPKKISIIPAGIGMGGYTKLTDEEDRSLYTKSYLFSMLQVLLAGRVAEEIIFGEEKVSTGAENDLREATGLAWKIVCDLGMSKLGQVTFGKKESSAFLPGEDYREKTYSDQTAKEIDEEIKRIINESYQAAKKLIEENRPKLKALVDALLEKDELNKEEILAVLSGKKLNGNGNNNINNPSTGSGQDPSTGSGQDPSTGSGQDQKAE